MEASGGWYWFVDALEAAGLDVRLVHPLEAKKRMGGRNKNDQLDAKGLALLLRNGTLPEIWIPPAGLRDLRGLVRTRLALRRHPRTLKKRVHGALLVETRLATRPEWEVIDQIERRGSGQLRCGAQGQEPQPSGGGCGAIWRKRLGGFSPSNNPIESRRRHRCLRPRTGLRGTSV